MSGWVKLHRIIQEWEWYKDSQMVHLFVHLVTSANHKPGKWQGKTIETGQLVTGLKSLSEKTGISMQSLRTCINRLKSTGEITSKSTNKFTIITICKYECYQNEIEGANKQINKQANKPLTNEQQTDNKQLTTNKNEDNVRTKEEKREMRPFVFLTDSEFKILVDQYGQIAADWMLDKLSSYKESTGKKYKSDSGTIKNWVVKSWVENTKQYKNDKSDDMVY